MKHSANVVQMLLLGHTFVVDGWEDGWEWWASTARDSWERESVEVEGLGTVVTAYEGSRPSDYESFESADRALIFTIGDRAFRKTGEYASHGGPQHWSGDFEEVTQVTTEVTKYEEKKMTDFSALPLYGIESRIEGHEFTGEGWGGETYTDSGWHQWEDELSLNEVVEVADLGSVQVVDRQPGREGGGENIYIVFKVGERFFKKTGYYASYDGSNWDGSFTEVTPQDRVVTFYEPLAG